VTVRGYLISDELADVDAGPTELAYFEACFRRVNAHIDCVICTGPTWAQRAFCWPRNGFGEFPLDFKPALAPVVQSV
jgi:hypothetical protein